MSEEEQIIDEAEAENLLVELDEYLVSGVHIGTTISTRYMHPFIYRVRNDGLYVLDVKKLDERLRIAAKFLARYDPSKVAVFSTRQYGTVPSSKMARVCGFKSTPGRFIPGTLTNPNARTYIEPDVVLLNDPRADKQALMEAKKMGIPIAAFCDSDNVTSYVDFIIPVNNKGRRSLARAYHTLTQQILRERGELDALTPLDVSVEEFSFRLRDA